jgi:hypothetical protein
MAFTVDSSNLILAGRNGKIYVSHLPCIFALLSYDVV